MKGTPPSPRDSHSCTTVGDNLFIFGGTDGLNPLKDLHILDTCKFFFFFPFDLDFICVYIFTIDFFSPRLPFFIY